MLLIIADIVLILDVFLNGVCLVLCGATKILCQF
jgi:hypothetical protein